MLETRACLKMSWGLLHSLLIEDPVALESLNEVGIQNCHIFSCGKLPCDFGIDMSGGDADAAVKWNLIKQFIEEDIPGLNQNIYMSVGSMWPEVHIDPSTRLSRNVLDVEIILTLFQEHLGVYSSNI